MPNDVGFLIQVVHIDQTVLIKAVLAYQCIKFFYHAVFAHFGSFVFFALAVERGVQVEHCIFSGRKKATLAAGCVAIIELRVMNQYPQR